MANDCNNTLVFNGSPEKVEAAHELFKKMMIEQQRTNLGQCPEFITEEQREEIGARSAIYMFDICIEDGADDIHYTSKWCPNEDVIRHIAQHFGVSFELEYEELGNGLYGMFVYDNEKGNMEDIMLENEEIERVVVDDEGRVFFDGDEVESEWECYESMLNKKRNT